MSVSFLNGSYRIQNGLTRGDDKEYLSVASVNDPGDPVIVVANADAATEWLLTDQGFAGPDRQVVSLQCKVSLAPVQGMGFFHVNTLTDKIPVTYSPEASMMKLEKSSDKLVTICFSKGDVSLLLTSPVEGLGDDTQVTITSEINDCARQQWRFLKVKPKDEPSHGDTTPLPTSEGQDEAHGEGQPEVPA